MTDKTDLNEKAADILNRTQELQNDIKSFVIETGDVVSKGMTDHGDSFLISGLTVFILACFVGYYVVWRVTPALHSPLMAITNAISSVIIVGALIAAGPAQASLSQFMGFLAVVLASVNIFGGFIVTRRMLGMFRKKETKA